MAVDRGGLQYRIAIEDAFSTPLDAFVKGIRDARKELEGLRTSSRGLRDTSNAIRETLKATREARAQSARAAKDELNNAKIRALAQRQINRETLKAAVSQRKATTEIRDSLNNARRLKTANEQLVSAERRLTAILDKRGQASRLLAAAQRRKITLTQEEKRAAGALTAEERDLLSAREKLQRLTREGGGELARINAEAEALRRKNRAAKEAAVTELLRRQGLDPSGRQITTEDRLRAATERRRAALEKLRGVLGRVDQQANRVSFTFRRLFGILAAFAAARAVLRGFRNLVGEMVRFNAAIEQSTLGVASLFLAVGDVRDITGQAVNATQGLALAQAEARKQVQLLRRDALKTSATFEQLLETFQVAVAPGFQAGLDIDQIRKFTLDISRAASAIGLAQNQLAEEIRSILSGTIQARTTRIAVALGISNEDIRNAREAGVLFEFLQEKFSAFDAAGEEALKTFNALWTNLYGGFQQVLEQGGLEFFNELKGILADLFDILINQDPITETLTPDPKAVAIIKEFANALQRGLQLARETGESLTFEDLIGAARAAGNAIVFAAQVVSSLIKGAIQGLRDLGRLARGIAKVFQGIVGKDLFDNSTLQETVALGARILTIFLGITAATAILKLGLSAVVVVVGVLAKVWTIVNGLIVVTKALVLGLQAALAPISIPAWAIVAAIVAIIAGLVIGVKLLKDWFDEIAGVELKFKSFLKLVAANAKFVFKDTVNSIAKFFDLLVQRISDFFSTSLSRLVIGVTKLFEKLLSLLAKVSDSAAELLEDVREFREGKESKLARQIEANADDLRRTAEAYDEASRQLQEQLARESADIIANDENEETLEEFARRVIGGFATEVGDFFKGVFADLLPDIDSLSSQFELDSAVQDAESLTAAFDEMGGVIARNRQDLSANAELMKELRDEALKARQALDLSRTLEGISGPVAEIITTLAESRNKLEKEGLALEKERQQALTNRLGLQNKLYRNEQRILELNEDETRLLNQSEALLRTLTDAQRRRAEVDNRRVLAEVEARVATQQGYREAAAAAQQRADAEQAAVTALDEQIDALRQMTDAVFESAQLSDEQRQAVRQALLARLQLQGELVAAEETIKQIIEDQLFLERQRNAIVAQRITQLAEEAALESQRRQTGLGAEILRLQAEQEALAVRNNAIARQIVAQAELDATTAEIDLAAKLRQLELEKLSDTITQRAEDLQKLKDQLAQGGQTDEAEKQLLSEINVLETERNALIAQREQLKAEGRLQNEIERLQLEELARIAEEERKKAEEPISFGFEKGIEEFVRDALDVFTTFQQIVANSFQQLASTIGKAFTNALTGEEGNFREDFRRFLSQVAEQIISMLVQVAIAKALLGLGFLGGAEGGQISFGGILGGGLAKGGRTDKAKQERGMVVFSPFAKARGFATGGLPRPTGEGVPPIVTKTLSDIKALRPRGLDPRDQIPIWTAPGEWVVRAKAVKLYGNDVMSALNSMLIDPTALRAIAGINTRGRVTRKVAHAAAAGGQITSTSGAPVVRESGGGGERMPPIAIVAGNEDTMQQLLVGGGPALLDFLRVNRDEFMGEERAQVR